ncbi:MAG: lipoyl(octanoyl) transferase LipB [Planctomycetes bacterium]|nr:lipoyl(octanoyl) transferase LipB [Planctomycetota bacterium]
MDSSFTIKTAFLGRIPYEEAWDLQKVLLERVSMQRGTGYILFLEHDPVITLGRGGTWDHLVCARTGIEQMGISLVECDRGGDITVHYPGQLISYPIIPMEHLQRNVHWFLRSLEEAGIRAAALLGISGSRKTGLTGVWVGEEKIMAIGVGFRKWISYHGTAFNVFRDNGMFDMIVPCGIRDKGVTSIEAVMGNAPPLSEVAALMRSSMEEVFCVDTEEVPSEDIWATVSRHG